MFHIKNFMQLPLTSTLLCPNLFLSYILSNNPSPSSILNVKYRVSNPYKAKDKFIVSQSLIFNFCTAYYPIKHNIRKWNVAHVSRILKGKAIHVQVLTGPVGSTRLRLPDFKIIYSPLHRPSLYVTGWVEHRVIVPPEELSQWKIPME